MESSTFLEIKSQASKSKDTGLYSKTRKTLRSGGKLFNGETTARSLSESSILKFRTQTKFAFPNFKSMSFWKEFP